MSELSERIQNMLVARKAITDKVGKQRGIVGEIECPVCDQGKLRYSVARSNGHIHAACTNPDCVRWME
jgi:ssDNA-binding Zn-finger/Zn-ribbon topoisomerase 1